MKDQGYTHLQIICCGVVLKPLRELPERALDKPLEELAPHLVCKCGKHATLARVALWKHGMKRYG
ncbi:hypothetical protein Brsp02_04898 [Brucella sp. NBRC 113783]